MKRNVSGDVSNQCNTCYNMIGKGSGYRSVWSDEEIEEWLSGLQGRKQKLIEDKKING